MGPIDALKKKDLILNGYFKEYSRKLPISILYTQMAIQKVEIIQLETKILLDKFRYDTIFATIKSIKPWFSYDSTTKKMTKNEIAQTKSKLANVESTLSDIINKWSNVEAFMNKILNDYYEIMLLMNKVENVKVKGKIYEITAGKIRDLFVDINKGWMEIYKMYGV